MPRIASRRPALPRNRAWSAAGCINGLCFIGTELHKGLFVTLLDKKAPSEAKDYVLGKNLSRLDHLENYLRSREFLLDHFSVADAYLFTVINWTMATPPIELAKWPAVKAYYERLRTRPSVAKAIAEEFELYKANSPVTRQRLELGITPTPTFLSPSPCRVELALRGPGVGPNWGLLL